MIPNETIQTIETAGEGVQLVAKFRVTDETMPRLLVDLSDKMYNQKELAVVREYSTNAADATIKNGGKLNDIQVTLPTYEDLVFKIRDFGEGLTEEKISDVYCVLGASDKRNTNLYNGMFGYGCKAGFAHADSFTVTSWVNGEKTVYQCVKGDTKKPHSAYRLSRCQSDEPSGIEIAIPVKQSSMWTFHQVAAQFYKYWPVLPTINRLEPSYQTQIESYRATVPSLKGEGWEIRPSNGNSARGVAYMGYVAYPIDWDVLYHKMSLNQQKRVLFDILKSNNLTLFFNIGDVSFVNNREGLEYTDETMTTVMNRIEGIFSKIKDVIQEKFDPAPNIWEAKKIYNSIFGSGIIELEKGESDDGLVERIRILDGNLMKLEQTFANCFKWNGITLDSAYFKKINRFDNAETDIKDENHSPIDPVMITFRKKNKRVKVARCTSAGNNGITASIHSAVIINDMGIRNGVQQVARYLIFKENSKIKTVHVFNFKSAELHEKFNKEYNFDTVPVIKLSSILVEAKMWCNANKATRSYGGGGGGTRVMKYMDIANNCIEESDVAIRDIEEGGYFIDVSESSRKEVTLANKVSCMEPEHVVDYLHDLVEKLGIDLDRVYIISRQTKQSKWFTGAIDSGDWINVWDYIRENMDSLNITSLVDAQNYDSNSVICYELGKKIAKNIKDASGIMGQLVNVVTSGDYKDNVEITKSLLKLGFWNELTKNTKGTVDFNKLSEKVNEKYPLISQFGWRLSSDSLNENEIESIVNYVNAMDLYTKTVR